MPQYEVKARMQHIPPTLPTHVLTLLPPACSRAYKQRRNAAGCLQGRNVPFVHVRLSLREKWWDPQVLFPLALQLLEL